MAAGHLHADRDADRTTAEEAAAERVAELGIDVASMAAVSNIFRAATAIRSHMERTVLASSELSFTAFTVLWVLWVWGEQEARHVADEAGISRGTLTGVVTTLEGRGLVRRRGHPTDRRSVLVSATHDGERLITELFPAFNDEEAAVSAGLDATEKDDLAHALRTILHTVDRLDP